MANGDTKTEALLNILGNGGDAAEYRGCCNTKTQSYILDAIDRVESVEEEVEELKNNPDVVDIVATYADLQAYDTSTLTDKDIIRVLADENHDGESTYYRYNKQGDSWTYIGTVGDYYTKTAADAKFQDKLTAGSNITIDANNEISATDTTYSNFVGTDGTSAGTAGLVPAPATTDAGKFLKADGTWDTIQAGGITVLTSADYNWNSTTGSATEPYDCIAPWLLPEGVYAFNNAYVVVYPYTNQTRYNDIKWMIAGQIPTTGDRQAEIQWGVQFYRLSMSYSGGSISSTSTSVLLNAGNVINNLTSTSTTSPLAANQGRALKNLIDSLVIKAAGAPTTSTVGTVGMLYEDTTNGDLYICTDITGGVYTWEEVGAGGGGIIELTSADYNYPTNNPTSLALWLLDEGTYVINGNGSAVSVKMNSGRTDTVLNGVYVIADYSDLGDGRKQIVGFYNNNGTDIARFERVSTNGAYLNGAQLNNPTIAQSTGTSYTDVMSQNAVTSMVYRDPNTRQQVQIGWGSVASGSYSTAIGRTTASGLASIAIGTGYDFTTASGRNSVALGVRASASQRGSVALGSYSGNNITAAGMVDIGTIDTSDGYNSSNYRLLTGLYDPQSAHDAATKGYVDPTTDSSAPTTSTVGRLGEIRIDTTSDTAYMCTKVDNGSYTWKQITA